MKKVLFLIALAASLLSCSKEVSCNVNITNNSNKTYMYFIVDLYNGGFYNTIPSNSSFIHKNETHNGEIYVQKKDVVSVAYSDTLTGKMYRCLEIYTYNDCKSKGRLTFNVN